MNGQISIFDYIDEKQNINIFRPHINIENVYVKPLDIKPKKKSKPKRKRGNILYRQTKFYENCEKRIFDGIGMNDIPPIAGMYDIEEPDELRESTAKKWGNAQREIGVKLGYYEEQNPSPKENTEDLIIELLKNNR